MKIAAVLTVLLLLMGIFCGCEQKEAEATTESVQPTTEATQPAPTEDPMKAAYKADPASFVKFSQSIEPREVYVPIDVLMEYESQYADCNGTWFRDTLSGEDLCIYNAYLYAMERRYIGFTLYVEDNDKDFSYIREALALDSPLLEQSLNYYGEDIHAWPTNYIGEQIHVRMEQFTGTRWDKKMEAVDVCRSIVAQIPETCVTQEEKMRYLYRYVCDHVEYVAYEFQADEDYLYDAVCKGKTVCDGYSNMLNLLFNLIGVDCCEVIGVMYEDFEQATEEQLQGGHTWVAAELDGVYYNFDPTYEDTKDEAITDPYAFFAFSDAAVSKPYLKQEEGRPKCTDPSRDFLYADLIVDSVTDGSQIRQIAHLAERKAAAGQMQFMVAVRQKVTQEDYDTMIDRFGYYSYSIGKIQTDYMEMNNSTLMLMTVTLR